MTTTNPGDLFAHLLTARDTTHPGISDAFLAEVVKAVEDAGSDVVAATRAIEAAVNRALAEGAG